jgi:hypothetical protein
MEVSGQHNSSAALPPGKESWNPCLGHRVGLGCFGEEKSLLFLPKVEPQTIQPVAKSQYQLCYPHLAVICNVKKRENTLMEMTLNLLPELFCVHNCFIAIIFFFTNCDYLRAKWTIKLL